MPSRVCCSSTFTIVSTMVSAALPIVEAVLCVLGALLSTPCLPKEDVNFDTAQIERANENRALAAPC